MRVTNIISAAMLVLSELSLISAKALVHTPYRIRRDLDRDLRRGALAALDGTITKRVPQSSGPSLSPAMSRTEMNQTISETCVSALTKITTISNDAGIVACYNILQHDPATGNFQADLRLYHAAKPTGDFADIAPDNLMIGVEYASVTTYSSLMKRSIRPRQTSASMTEMQQYSLLGTFAKTIDTNKLNQTELMSLMIPQVVVNAVKPNSATSISTNITTTNTAYLVIGDFKGDFTPLLASSALQEAAIAHSSAFKLPGVTLGMFPTGLIITCSWLLIFVVAYGAGTIGRWRNRSFYRRRQAAMSGRRGQ